MMFVWCCGHRTIQSFPTRRSSDLNQLLQPGRGWDARPVAAHVLAVRPSRGVHPRSEEHTSELQSHVNIVCRFLLEKDTLTSTDIAADPVLLSNLLPREISMHYVFR